MQINVLQAVADGLYGAIVTVVYLFALAIAVGVIGGLASLAGHGIHAGSGDDD